MASAIASSFLQGTIRPYFSVTISRATPEAKSVVCLTKYSGYDPEVDTRRKTPLTPGVDCSAYPKSTGYVVGVNITF